MSTSWVRVPVRFGSLTKSILFHVLDTPIDLVFGMAWLKQVNPRIDWQSGHVALLHKGLYHEIPSVFHKGSQLAMGSLQSLYFQGVSDEVERIADSHIDVVPVSTFVREACKEQYAQMFFACISSAREVAELGFASYAEATDEQPPSGGDSVLRVPQPGQSDIVFLGPGLSDVDRVCAEFSLERTCALRQLYVALRCGTDVGHFHLLNPLLDGGKVVFRRTLSTQLLEEM